MAASSDQATTMVTLRRPDDWHVHLRDGAMLKAVVPPSARQFGRVVVMPNLNPPIVKVEDALEYRQRIMAAVPEGLPFKPLMTSYLTDDTDPVALTQGHRAGIFVAAKLYPAHATTNTARGVTDIGKLDKTFTAMERAGMPLLIHGEVTDAEVDIFDREAVFIQRALVPLMRRFPALKIVFEHVTTTEAIDFVMAAGPSLAATVTAHHLIINRNALFQGGLRPHHYCLPVAKREHHRLALRRAATSGSAKFFLGTDSAPHPVVEKESACGCAGIFTAATALEFYAEVFGEEEKLDRLEAFASLNGPAFYGLEPNEERVTLRRSGTVVPEKLEAAGAEIRPFRAGERLGWRLV